MTKASDTAGANYEPQEMRQRRSAPRTTEEAFLIQAEYVRAVLLAHTALWSSLLTLPTETTVPAAEARPPQRRAA